MPQRFDPETVSPRCPKCYDVTRLVGIEPHATLAHIVVHTYECTPCRYLEVVEIARDTADRD
jgi:hypothetical protein